MTTKTRRAPSTHAAAAKAIRADLKQAYPEITFKVTSRSNVVNISWTDGPTDNQVERLVSKYQMGSFDGMIDCYEYTNRREDIPQVGYVFAQRGHSIPTIIEGIDYLNKRYGWTLAPKQEQYGDGEPYCIVDPATDGPCEFGGYASHQLHRHMHPQSFICEECRAPAHMGDAFCSECGAGIAHKEY